MNCPNRGGPQKYGAQATSRVYFERMNEAVLIRFLVAIGLILLFRLVRRAAKKATAQRAGQPLTGKPKRQSFADRIAAQMEARMAELQARAQALEAQATAAVPQEFEIQPSAPEGHREQHQGLAGRYKELVAHEGRDNPESAEEVGPAAEESWLELLERYRDVDGDAHATAEGRTAPTRAQTTRPARVLRRALREPQAVKQAVVLSEVLRKKY